MTFSTYSAIIGALRGGRKRRKEQQNDPKIQELAEITGKTYEQVQADMEEDERAEQSDIFKNLPLFPR